MISGKTRSGFEFEVDERLLDDWDMCEQLTRAQSEDRAERMSGFFELGRLLLGDKLKKLKKHVKTDGIVPVNLMIEELAEIIVIMSEEKREVKNS